MGGRRAFENERFIKLCMVEKENIFAPGDIHEFNWSVLPDRPKRGMSLHNSYLREFARHFYVLHSKFEVVLCVSYCLIFF